MVLCGFLDARSRAAGGAAGASQHTATEKQTFFGKMEAEAH